MILDYKEMESRISHDIKVKQEQLNTLYETLDEANKFGYVVTFGQEDNNSALKDAVEAGRAIGDLEGQIDQLRSFLNFLYNEEYNKK
jgi:hypothetical protein